MAMIIRGMLLVFTVSIVAPLAACEVTTVRAVDDKGTRADGRYGQTVEGVRVFRPGRH